MSNLRKKPQREFSELEAKKQLRKLTIQNNKLNREVDALKQELEMLQGKGGRLWGTGKYRNILHQRADSETMFSKKSYISFVWTHLMHSSFFDTYKRILNYVRKYALITTTLKIVSLLFVFVEAVLVIVISTSAFIATLLFTLLITQVLTMLSLLSSKKQTASNTARLMGKDVVIFFPPKERAFEDGSYFKYLVNDYASKDNCHVVVVTPYLFNSRGVFSCKKPYHSARPDTDSILLVRKNYYFSLRKKVIDTTARSITEIY